MAFEPSCLCISTVQQFSDLPTNTGFLMVYSFLQSACIFLLAHTVCDSSDLPASLKTAKYPLHSEVVLQSYRAPFLREYSELVCSLYHVISRYLTYRQECVIPTDPRLTQRSHLNRKREALVCLDCVYNFLDRQASGDLFWPDYYTSRLYNASQFSADRL